MSAASFQATVIAGGQIEGEMPALYLIYPKGNFIEITEDTPFFQIGETKYGEPILVSAYDPEMSLQYGVKLLLVSFDSTFKANLSVGLPIDVQTYKNDTFEIASEIRIESEDPMNQSISRG
jgi:putative proteasome-type protease